MPLAAPNYRLTGPGVKGACGVAARALRAPVTPAAGSHDLAAIQDMRPDRHAPAPSPKSPRTGSNQAQNMQKLDRPLHMRSEPLLRSATSGYDNALIRENSLYLSWLAEDYILLN